LPCPTAPSSADERPPRARAFGAHVPPRYNPPRTAGKDDVTGEALIQRADDSEETVRKRLEVYHLQTQPLIAYYARWEATGDRRAPRYRKVDGQGSVESIRDACLAALDS
jgi:adenylate kinase